MKVRPISWFKRVSNELTDFMKKFMFIVGFSAIATPVVYKLVAIYDDNVGVYFKETGKIVKYWRVNMGMFEAVLDRVNTDHVYYVKMADDKERDAILMRTGDTPPEHFVFIEDPLLGTIAFAAYYNTGRDTWYFYSFDEEPFTLIHER